MSSSHVANQGDGPPDAQAIDGACGQLVEQNALPSNETCDLEAWKKRENINVLNQARSNIAALGNESTANKIRIYANIAAMIPTKTIRDVAWRVKLMADLLSDPSADSSSHVADQEDDRTSKALSESPEAMDPQVELDEELVDMHMPRSSM